MFPNDKLVKTIFAPVGLMDFIQWLENIPGDNHMLVAHNCKHLT